LKKKMEG
jgi:hypothetical protein